MEENLYDEKHFIVPESSDNQFEVNGIKNGKTMKNDSSLKLDKNSNK